MAQQALTRRHPLGYGLEKSLEATRNPGNPVPIPLPSTNVSSTRLAYQMR